jgi:hypothetical protein
LLNERRAGSAKKGIVPVWLGLVADIKLFGGHKGRRDPRRRDPVGAAIKAVAAAPVIDRIAALVLAGSAVVMVFAVAMLIGLLLVRMLRG